MAEIPLTPGKGFDPSMIRDEQWVYEGTSPDGLQRRYVYVDAASGMIFRKKENLIEDNLLRLNQDQLHDSRTQRFGDGKVIARIPMNVAMQEIAPRLKQGDRDYLKWFLNHDEKRMYRNFRGRV